MLPSTRTAFNTVTTDWLPMLRTISTARLELDAWRTDDIDDYQALVNERDQRFPTAPRGSDPTRDEATRTIARLAAAIDDTGIGLLVVRVHGRFRGYCGLIVGRSTLDEPEIAYELARSVQGNGYATEAARAIVSAASDTGRTGSGQRCASGTPPRSASSTRSASSAPTAPRSTSTARSSGALARSRLRSARTRHEART